MSIDSPSKYPLRDNTRKTIDNSILNISTPQSERCGKKAEILNPNGIVHVKIFHLIVLYTNIQLST